MAHDEVRAHDDRFGERGWDRLSTMEGAVEFAVHPHAIAAPAERGRLLDADFVRRLLEEGSFHNDVPGTFTGGYGVRTEAVAPFFAGHGFTALRLLASEGFVGELHAAMADLAASAPQAYQAALNLVVRTADDPRQPARRRIRPPPRQPPSAYRAARRATRSTTASSTAGTGTSAGKERCRTA